MPSGPKEIDNKTKNSVSPSALPRRLAMLNSLAEKCEIPEENSETQQQVRMRGQVVPSMHDKSRSQDSDAENCKAACAGYQLSPRTLRRLEHKHQVAKLQQEKRTFDLSPPVSPRTYRKLILTRGGAINARRFTVARTRYRN